MLERCPHYEKCSAETRQIRGNREHYCLGSLNWEYCPQFKFLSLGGESFQGYSRDDAIKRIAKKITQDLKDKLRFPLKVSLITHQGEVLYRDYLWADTDTLVAQNLIRYKMQSMSEGKFLKLQNGENLLFLKIHEAIMLVCYASGELDKLIEVLKTAVSNYRTNLDAYLKDHPISVEMESTSVLEENLILNLFEDLQKKLKAINPEMVISDLNKIREKISEIFSWNRIFYEISVLVERLEKYPVETELNRQEKEELLRKIKEWGENIRRAS